MLKKAYRADPKRTDDGASESPARGRCPHGRLRWDRRNTTSQGGVPHYRHARPGGTTDGDGTDDGKRLAPPFRGNTDMGANSNPTTKRTMGERATENANCPATSVVLPATKPTTMAPNGPAPT